MEILTTLEASARIGVPETQLRRFAAQRAVGFKSGPEYIGSDWLNPKYRDEDLEKWLSDASLSSSGRVWDRSGPRV